MTEHNRREEYWRFYGHMVVAEAAHLRGMLIRLIRERPRPRQEGGSRVRPTVHSKEKLDFACLWMMAHRQTYRKTESGLGEMRAVWDDKPVPDHATPVRHMQAIWSEWMDEVLAETVRHCLAEADGTTAPLGADSSVVAATRYGGAGRPGMDARGFIEKPQKIYRKCHIAAILGGCTSYWPRRPRRAASTVPTRRRPCRRRQGAAGSGSRAAYFTQAGGHDADYNYWMIFWTGMTPNIK